MSPLDAIKTDLCGQVEYKLSAPVVVSGISLGSDSDDRTKFDTLRALISGGAITGSVTIKDTGGVFHSMPAGTAESLLLEYGAIHYARWVSAEGVKAQVFAANDEAEARALFSAWSLPLA